MLIGVRGECTEPPRAEGGWGRDLWAFVRTVSLIHNKIESLKGHRELTCSETFFKDHLLLRVDWGQGWSREQL